MYQKSLHIIPILIFIYVHKDLFSERREIWLNLLYSSAPSSVKTEVKLVCTPMQRIF